MDRTTCLFPACTVGALLALSLLGGGGTSSALAQTGVDRNVALLPFLSSTADSTFAAEYSAAFRSGIRRGNWLRLMEEEDGGGPEDLGSLRKTLRSPGSLREYLTTRSSSFLITGVMTREPGGRVEVSSIVYSREEGAVVGLEKRSYPDEEAAREDAPRLGSALSHPSRFVTGDTAFFYSMILPGAGQLSRGRPGWALVSAGLVVGSFVYRNSLPDGDPFRFDSSRFQDYREVRDGRFQYVFLVDGEEVTQEYYEQKVREDRAHSATAMLDRRRAAAKKGEASLFVLGAYVFNIMNTLFLSGREADDGQAFFSLIKSFEQTPSGLSARAGFQFRLSIDP
ncbi:MAG: hypothetical protein R6W82_09500 [bacterium]